MFQVKGRVEWMEGWYATPFMGAIFPCGKDIHHEMFSRLWNAWKWINRQMALHPCNRPEILLAHVFVQDIMQIRGKFQKLSFSFKVDWRKAATWMKYLFIIYDATQYSFQMTCNQKLHPWVHIALGLSRVTRRNVQSSLICRIFKCCQANWCLRCPSISDRQNRCPGCALGCPIAKLFSCHYVAPGHNVAPSHHVAPRPKQHLCTIHF